MTAGDDANVDAPRGEGGEVGEAVPVVLVLGEGEEVGRGCELLGGGVRRRVRVPVPVPVQLSPGPPVVAPVPVAAHAPQATVAQPLVGQGVGQAVRDVARVRRRGRVRPVLLLGVRGVLLVLVLVLVLPLLLRRERGRVVVGVLVCQGRVVVVGSVAPAGSVLLLEVEGVLGGQQLAVGLPEIRGPACGGGGGGAFSQEVGDAPVPPLRGDGRHCGVGCWGSKERVETTIKQEQTNKQRNNQSNKQTATCERDRDRARLPLLTSLERRGAVPEEAAQVAQPAQRPQRHRRVPLSPPGPSSAPPAAAAAAATAAARASKGAEARGRLGQPADGAAERCAHSGAAAAAAAAAGAAPRREAFW